MIANETSANLLSRPNYVYTQLHENYLHALRFYLVWQVIREYNTNKKTISY